MNDMDNTKGTRKEIYREFETYLIDRILDIRLDNLFRACSFCSICLNIVKTSEPWELNIKKKSIEGNINTRW